MQTKIIQSKVVSEDVGLDRNAVREMLSEVRLRVSLRLRPGDRVAGGVCEGSIVLSLSLFRFVRLSFSVRQTVRLPVSEAGPRGEENPPFQATERQGDAGMHRILFNRYPMLKLVYAVFLLHMFHGCPCIVVDNVF